MTDKVFFDTNILVYAYDTHDLLKQKTAIDLILANSRVDQGVISVQVLGEFFNVVTRRIPQPLTIDEARTAINHLTIMETIDIDTTLVNRAIDVHHKYATSYWDSLIIAAAERGQCPQLISEDMNNQQQYFGVTVINPFVNIGGSG